MEWFSLKSVRQQTTEPFIKEYEVEIKNSARRDNTGNVILVTCYMAFPPGTPPPFPPPFKMSQLRCWRTFCAPNVMKAHNCGAGNLYSQHAVEWKFSLGWAEFRISLTKACKAAQFKRGFGSPQFDLCPNVPLRTAGNCCVRNMETSRRHNFSTLGWSLNLFNTLLLM